MNLAVANNTVAWSLVNFLGRNGYVKHQHFVPGEELTGRTPEELRQVARRPHHHGFQDPMQALDRLYGWAISSTKCSPCIKT
ncbi:MAG: hypothetical protein R2911_22240 [Caldilineaceae bacterium]